MPYSPHQAKTLVSGDIQRRHRDMTTSYGRLWHPLFSLCRIMGSYLLSKPYLDPCSPCILSISYLSLVPPPHLLTSPSRLPL